MRPRRSSFGSKRNRIAHHRPRNGSQRCGYCPNLKLATRRARISGVPPTTARVDGNNANPSSAAASSGLSADLPPASTRRDAKRSGLSASHPPRANHVRHYPAGLGGDKVLLSFPSQKLSRFCALKVRPHFREVAVNKAVAIASNDTVFLLVLTTKSQTALGLRSVAPTP